MNDNKRQARIAGLLYLLVAITAPLGLMVVPARLIVAGDPAATAALVAGHDTLLRMGMASELFHQAVEVFMVLVLYNLFKPVNRTLAQQMLVLGLVPIPMVFINVLGEVAASTVASSPAWLAAFGKPQLDALALLFMHLHAQGLQLAAVFWGLWLLPLGLLALRCGFIPKVFGWLVIASSIGYVLGSFTSLIAPGLASTFATPVFLLELGEPMMILWLVLVGARTKPVTAPAALPA
jgi:hypothetical protein